MSPQPRLDKDFQMSTVPECNFCAFQFKLFFRGHDGWAGEDIMGLDVLRISMKEGGHVVFTDVVA